MSDIYVNDVYYHILNSKARVIINYGGRDSGKSFFTGGQYIPISMINDPYFRGVGLRKTYASIKDSVFMEIEDGIDMLDHNHVFKFTKQPLEIEHKNKNKMIFRGLDDPKKIKSLKGLNFIWVEEAEDLTETQFDDLLILLRGDGYQRMMLTFNPVDEDHFSNDRFVSIKKDRILETFDDGEPKVWELDINEKIDGEIVQYTVLVICSTFEDNDFIEPVRKLVIEKLKYTNPFLYEVYRKGKFASRGGRILTNTEQLDFEAEGLEFNNFDNKGYAQDFGFNHANAILSVAEKDNCLYIFDEIYVYEKDTNEIIDLCKRDNIQNRLRMVCDCAEPDRIKMFKKAGYNATGVKKYAGSVNAQIDRLKQFDRIYINTKCINTWKESKCYIWKQNKEGKYIDEPIDIFDDAMAALRYSTDLFYKSSGTKTVQVRF